MINIDKVNFDPIAEHILTIATDWQKWKDKKESLAKLNKLKRSVTND